MLILLSSAKASPRDPNQELYDSSAATIQASMQAMRAMQA